MADEPDKAETDEKVTESTAAEIEDPVQPNEATEDDVEQVDDVDEVADVDETDEDANRPEGRLARWRQRAGSRFSRAGSLVVASAVIVATLTGLAGWLGFRAYQKHEAEAQRDVFVQIARQGAVNLTTINYTEVDADMQRIIDLSTGAFRDDFLQRSKPFIEVVKAAQSKSEGTVTDAGLESQRGDSAQVLVAITDSPARAASSLAAAGSNHCP